MDALKSHLQDHMPNNIYSPGQETKASYLDQEQDQDAELGMDQWF